MEKKEYMYHLLRKSEKDFENNEIFDAREQLQLLRSRYGLPNVGNKKNC